MRQRHFGRELWDRMCEFVKEDDGLPFYTCGTWTISKLFYVCQYLAQTTQSMVGNRYFSSLNYVDLFCGSGVCVPKDADVPRRYPGSALLAAGCKKPFTNLFLVDEDRHRLDALCTRLDRLKCECQIHPSPGDANTLIDRICQAIPDRSLTVTFVDPESLHIHFSSIQHLASHRQLDLIILFADQMDIVRNVEKDYYPGRSDKLDLFLGENSGWRKKWDALENREAGNCRDLFAKIYLEQLSTLGYIHSRTLPIPSDRNPLYRLVYASKNPLGLKFWDIATSEDLGGDRSLFGV